MKRFLLCLACLAAVACLTVSASAEPVIAHNGYLTWLGENNWLYLQTPVRTMYLNTPMLDIVALTDHLYCLTQDNQLLEITLDGTQNLILATNPTQEQLEEVKGTAAYSLTESTLSLVNAAANAQPLSTTALMAVQNSDTLFWLETTAPESTSTMLKSVLLTEATATVQTLGDGVVDPVGLTATDDMVAMVAGDHSVTIVTLLDRQRQVYPAESLMTVRAASINGQLLRYTQDTDGHFSTESTAAAVTTLNASASDAPVYNPSLTTNQPTASPTTRPTITATPRPSNTARPSTTRRPSSSSSSSSSSSDRLSKGDRGSEVRKMQQRLYDLGYPVGEVDGVWGDDTQFAVNLFQCAIGYSEHNYATSGMLEKLYSKDAPYYDRFSPLKLGDRGTEVLLMQATLSVMGYNPGKLDGVYGEGTAAALMIFQSVGGLPVTGEATRETLELLYSSDCPLNPSVYPSATVAPTATPAPTVTPVLPTETPTPGLSTNTDL